MKRTLTLALAALALLSAQAGPIKQSRAQRRAQALLTELKSAPVTAEAVALDNEVKGQSASTASPAYYAFNAADGEGFVLLSGDDNFPELIGYAPKGQLAEGAMPPALAVFLSQYAQYVDDVRAGRALAPSAAATGESTGTPVVGPLMTCQWGQDSPYNMYCPTTSDGTATYVGCVATAAAQIMYTHRWPETGKGVVSYTPEGFGVQTVRFYESTYDWDSMKDTYSILDRKKASGKAVAKLSYDCGVATNMNYGTDGSGTTDFAAMLAMYKYFRYKASTIDLVWKDCCNDLDQFNSIWKAELNAGRPVQCSASSSSGSGRDAGGHSYVIDGYDSNNFVHINWGWDGSYDGYYDIQLMNPSGYQFDVIPRLIIGIEPDKDDSDTIPRQLRLMQERGPRTDYSSVGVKDKFTVRVDTVWNYWAVGIRTTLGIGLYDKEGNFLENVAVSKSGHTFSLGSYYGHSYDSSIECKLNKTDYPAGDYGLRVVYRNNTYTDYRMPYTTGGDTLNWIPAYIHDGKIYFNQVSAAISAPTNAADQRVVETAYYDLTGRPVAQPAPRQVYIRRQRLADGTVRTDKLLK